MRQGEKKILVTGGMGYIGSHTVVELQNAGYQVVIADNLSNSDPKILEGIAEITGKKPRFYKYDLADSRQTEDLFTEEKNIDAVIHFAAYKAVGESVKEPLKYYANNLNTTINILEQMWSNHVFHLVFSSSCTVYGQPEILPVTENSPLLRPSSPYGNTKRISEDIIGDSLAAHPEHSAILLRYFNPIGAHPSGKIGELPGGTPNNLVPYMTQTAAGVLDSLQIFGNDYNTPDGTAIRDYIHIVDLAKAHLAALERMLSGKSEQNCEIFNLGTGRGYSVWEMVKMFEKATGKPLNYHFASRREGDVEQIWTRASRAENILGWKAQYSIEEALRSAWNWEKKYRNL